MPIVLQTVQLLRPHHSMRNVMVVRFVILCKKNRHTHDQHRSSTHLLLCAQHCWCMVFLGEFDNIVHELFPLRLLLTLALSLCTRLLIIKHLLMIWWRRRHATTVWTFGNRREPSTRMLRKIRLLKITNYIQPVLLVCQFRHHEAYYLAIGRRNTPDLCKI